MASAKLFIVLKWVGACYLIWLGLSQFCFGRSRSEKADRNIKGSVRTLFLRGITVNSTNPKALVFYSTFFPPFINSNFSVAPQLMQLGATFICIFVVVAVLHAWSASRLGGMFNRSSAKRFTRLTSGAVLVGAGIFLATINRK